MKKRVGIYGGSFDPPHRSHKSIVDHCVKNNLVDEVWVLPSYNHTQKDIIVSFEQRIKMCKMMFCSLFKRRIKVKDYEKYNDDGSMFSLIVILRRMFPDYEFYIIIGKDCADKINTWKHTTALIDNIKFIVFDREDYYPQTTATWYFEKPHQFIEVPGCFISSTYVRKLASKKYFNLVKLLANKKISNFINKGKLYENPTNRNITKN